MLQKEIITKYASVVVALLTFVGIALHDTKIDKLTTLAVALPVIAATEGVKLLHLMGGDAHTHVERVSVKDTAKKNTGELPRVQVRREEARKDHGHNEEQKGTLGKPEYYMPVLDY